MTRRAAGWILAFVVALLLSCGAAGIHNEEGCFAWQPECQVQP